MVGFGLVVGIFLARTLGDEGRGAYVLATAFAGQLLLGFVNLGVETAASVMVAKDRGVLARLHTLIVILCAALALVLATLWFLAGEFLVTWVVPGLPLWALAALLAALPFWVYQFGCFGLLIGLGEVARRAKFELFFNIVQNLVVAILLTLFVLESITDVIVPLVVGYYGVILFGCPWIYRIVGRAGALWSLPERETWSRFAHYGFSVYVGNLGAGLGQRIDQYFVQQVGGGTAAFGVYTLATGLAARTRILPQALARGAYARISSADAPEAARLTAACFRQMLVLGLIFAVLGSAASPLIPLIYSASFAPAVIPFIIFLFGRAASNCAWMLSIYFTGYLGRPGIPMAINWGLLPIVGVGAWFALQMGGLIAVALISSLGYFLTLIAFLVLFLMWQKDVSARELLVPQREDFAAWRRLLPHKKQRT